MLPVVASYYPRRRKLRNFQGHWPTYKQLDVYKGIGSQKQMNVMSTAYERMGREFPGSPVVRTLSFHCRGPGFYLWLGN